MKQVSSRVSLNKSIIKNLEKASIDALKMTGDDVLGEVVNEQVVPFGDDFERGGDTHQGGTLQESGFVNDKRAKSGNVQITFNTPYARRLYFHPEYKFRKVDNPNAKGKWLEGWSEKGKYASDVVQAYAHFFRKLGGL